MDYIKIALFAKIKFLTKFEPLENYDTLRHNSHFLCYLHKGNKFRYFTIFSKIWKPIHWLPLNFFFPSSISFKFSISSSPKIPFLPVIINISGWINNFNRAKKMVGLGFFFRAAAGWRGKFYLEIICRIWKIDQAEKWILKQVVFLQFKKKVILYRPFPDRSFGLTTERNEGTGSSKASNSCLVNTLSSTNIRKITIKTSWNNLWYLNHCAT